VGDRSGRMALEASHTYAGVLNTGGVIMGVQSSSATPSGDRVVEIFISRYEDLVDLIDRESYERGVREMWSPPLP